MAALLQAEDSTKTVLQQIWIKAWREKSLTITLRDKASRTSTRLALYSIAKAVKAKPLEFPKELVDAVTGCQISIVNDVQLCILHRKINAIAGELAAQLGIDLLSIEQEASDKEAQEMQESLRRVMQATGKTVEVPEGAKSKAAGYLGRD